MVTNLRLAILFALTVAFASPVNGIVHASSFTFTPTEAGFLRSLDPDRNIAALVEAIGVYHYGADEHISYLKFDLSSFGPARAVFSMTLRLDANSISQFFGMPLPISVYHVSNDAWTTANITWNTQPGFDTLLGTVNYNPDNPAELFWREWDLTSFNFQRDINDGFLSLAVRVPGNSLNTGVHFSLAPSRIPSLTIVSAPPVPEPSTLLLLLSGLASLMLWRARTGRQTAS